MVIKLWVPVSPLLFENLQVTLFLREPVIILPHQNELVAILKNDKDYKVEFNKIHNRLDSLKR